MKTTDPNYNNVMSLLINSLPQKVNASNDKESANYPANKGKDRYLAIKYNSFIDFNSEGRVSLMIFDIDSIHGKKAIDVYTLDEIVFEIQLRVGCVPTYVLQTKKGYHFAYHLKNHVYLDQERPTAYLKAIKIAITKICDCDPLASHRLSGVWRNPLTHKTFFSGICDYELLSFRPLINNKNHSSRTINNSSNKKATKNTLAISISLLVKGKRNKTLSKFAVNYCLGNKQATINDLKTYLLNINEYAKPPLGNKEVKKIVNSIFKMKEADKLYHPVYKERNINFGSMKLAPIRGLSVNEYFIETKNRQVYAAKFTNDLIAKSKQMRNKREKNIKKAQKQSIESKKESNLFNIRYAIDKLKEEDKKLSYVNIAKKSDIDRRTVSKYVVLYDLVG